jgi:Zn-dependent protease
MFLTILALNYPMVFYKSEIIQMLISVITISLAFSLAIMQSFPIILLTVGLGFILHEVAHKLVAIRFGCKAFYKMWVEGLVLAVFLAVITGGRFIFAAPGAVYIFKHGLTRRENGLISIAGPATNIALAFIFLFIMFIPALSELGAWGFRINLFLAMFNLLPFPPLDGSKVISWNPAVWFMAIAVSGAFLFFPEQMLSLFI